MFLPVAFIRVKRHDETKSREFVKFIDGKIREEEYKAREENGTKTFTDGEKDNKINVEKKYIDDAPCGKNGSPKQAEKPSFAPPETARAELDFSHVKSVIERLDYSDLTQPERQKINQLKFYLKQAENGEPINEIRPRINESLGNLLKIMAKHGE